MKGYIFFFKLDKWASTLYTQPGIKIGTSTSSVIQPQTLKSTRNDTLRYFDIREH